MVIINKQDLWKQYIYIQKLGTGAKAAGEYKYHALLACLAVHP
jgi:hypothetical protein